MNLTQREAEEQLIERTAEDPFPAIRSVVGTLLPPWVVNSLLIRLAFAVVVTPVLAWWLIGFTYIPLLSVSRNNPVSTQTGADESETFDQEAVEQPSQLGPSCGTSVVMKIPNCTFLQKARDKYGETKGNTACVNE